MILYFSDGWFALTHIFSSIPVASSYRIRYRQAVFKEKDSSLFRGDTHYGVYYGGWRRMGEVTISRGFLLSKIIYNLEHVEFLLNITIV